jgi:SNF2 family DNA or RNA helicase
MPQTVQDYRPVYSSPHQRGGGARVAALTEETVYCEMEEEQAACYNEEKSKIRNVLLEQWNKADKSYTAAALSSLTRLRLLANHP